VLTEARGPMASVNTSRGLLGVALVLSPHEGPRTRWSLDAAMGNGAAAASLPQSAAARALAGNALADALPLFEALALPAAASITMAVGRQAALALRIAPHPPPRA